jgi:hypothetical protein
MQLKRRSFPKSKILTNGKTSNILGNSENEILYGNPKQVDTYQRGKCSTSMRYLPELYKNIQIIGKQSMSISHLEKFRRIFTS